MLPNEEGDHYACARSGKLSCERERAFLYSGMMHARLRSLLLHHSCARKHDAHLHGKKSAPNSPSPHCDVTLVV